MSVKTIITNYARQLLRYEAMKAINTNQDVKFYTLAYEEYWFIFKKINY